MSDDIKTKINNDDNEVLILQGNTENLPSLKIFDEHYLTDENDFENIVKNNSDLINKLVKFKSYTGKIEHDFTILNNQCVAIEIGEKQKSEKHSIEVNLFGKSFKGIIVKNNDNVEKIGICLEYIAESKFIDISKSCHFLTIHGEIEEKKFRFVKIKKSYPRLYGICKQKVEINTVECTQIGKNIKSGYSMDLYVRNDDIKDIEDFSSMQYHNQVIIKPDFIFKYETTIHTSNKLNKVRFKDSSGMDYQGEVLWVGKVNDDVPAVIVSSKDLTGAIREYVLNESIMQAHFGKKECGICVGQFAINTDVIAYKTLNKSKLEIVDPTYIHPFQNEPFVERILVFKFNDILHVAVLKWKGSIYNQFCVGLELGYEFDEGSHGTYGDKELFNCAQRKGVVITSEKLNDQKITDFCVFDNHKSLQLISTKLAFKIYDQTSICCVEKLDNTDLGKKNLKIGCKIMYKGDFIGICKFIGKVNNEPSVGIELNQDSIIETPCVFDYIDFIIVQKRKLCFMDLKVIDIGTFYKEESSPKKYNSYNRNFLNSRVTYHPGNNPTKSFAGEVKWVGKHENGNMVCGLELESEVIENSSSYFLENLFDFKPKHGIIDDDYKIESNNFESAYLESAGNSHLTESSENYSKIYKNIIHSLLNGKDMEVVDDLIMHFSNDFINYAKANKEMLKSENLELIINGLYEKDNFKLINDILNSIENKNEIFPFLKSLLSKCIKDKKFDCISDILTRVTTFQKTDDDNNQNCLNLAMECLENMNEENKKDYQLTYESFIGLCGNHECYIDDENVKETFITKIILNKSISENIIIDVLKFEIFNVNQLNSNSKSPMELTIDECRSNILEALFDSETLNTDKLKPIYDEFIINCSNLTHEQLLMIPIMKRKLDKMEQKSNSMCGTKEPGVSN